MSFITSVENFFKKFFTSAPQWTVTASTAIKLATPLAVAVLAAVTGDPAEAAEGVNIASEIVSDLGAVGTTLAQIHASPTASAIAVIDSALTSAQKNLNALLTAGHIKDATAQTTATLLVSELKAIADVLPK
jgi:hypothetical protein